MDNAKLIEIGQDTYRIWNFGEGIVGIEAIEDNPPPFPGVLVERLKGFELGSVPSDVKLVDAVVSHSVSLRRR